MSIHTMSEELREDLIELGLQRYVIALSNAGFDDWDAIGDSKSSASQSISPSQRVLA